MSQASGAGHSLTARLKAWLTAYDRRKFIALLLGNTDSNIEHGRVRNWPSFPNRHISGYSGAG